MGSDSEAEKSQQKERKKIHALAPIAKPLAGKKLCKRALKLVRRGISATPSYAFSTNLLKDSVFYLSRKLFGFPENMTGKPYNKVLI